MSEIAFMVALPARSGGGEKEWGRWKRILVVTALLVLCVPCTGTSVSPARAQEQATLRVVVTSGETGAPIPGANVLLLQERENEGDSIQHSGATDSDGFVEFRRVSPGRYQLRISFVGYETYESVVRLEGGRRQFERVTLSAETRRLEEVRVEGERNVATGAAGVRNVTGAEIERIPTPGPTGDLATYLRTLPGVTMVGSRGGNLYVRGGTPSQNQILVDNMSVIKPFHISNLFSAFPSEMVQSVDTYAGGFGAEYMGVTSAVIDVKLRPGNYKDYNASAAVSPHIVSLQTEGPISTDRHSFNVMARRSIIDRTSPTLIGEREGVQFYDILSRYSHKAENYHCSITGLRTSDRGRVNPTRNVRLGWSNTVVGGRCAGFNTALDRPFEVTLGYSGFNNSERSDAGFQDAGMDRLQAGLDFDGDLFGLSMNYGFSAWLSSYSATLHQQFTQLETFSASTAAIRLYGGTEWDPGNYFTLHPSLGTQVSLTDVTIEPRLRLSYRPDGTANQEISFALGRYSQLINGIRDSRDAGTVFTVLRPSNQDFPVQRAVHAVLGYEQRLGKYFEANIEGYLKRHSNISVPEWQPTVGVNTKTAPATGRAYGADVRIRYDRSPIYLYLSYGWSKVKYEAASEDLGAWVDETIFEYTPPHDRRHKLNLISQYRIGNFELGVRWKFGTGRPYTRVYGYDLFLQLPEQFVISDPGRSTIYFDRPYGARLPPYHRLDASVTYTHQLSSDMSIEAKLGALNLYDRENIFYYDANSLERVDQIPFFPYLALTANI